MRILHVADRLSDRGGAYTWMLGVVEGLSGLHECRLAVGRDEGGARPPCEVAVRPGLDSRTGEGFDLDDLAAAADVIHLHNVTNPALLEWAAERRNTLLTVQDHRLFCPGRGKWTAAGEVCRGALAQQRCASCFEDEGYFREVLALTERRLAAARRMAVTVLSRYMREELLAAGLSPPKVDVVPPFVHRLDTDAAPSGSPCVLFVGRLAESKGVLDAVTAWRLSGVDLPLVLAGTGPLRESLAADAARGMRLELTGWLGRSQLSGLYRRARALVLPSRWQEPFGIVGIEALACGVPVAAWQSGGVGEWHPGPGLVGWGDVSGLARALREAVARPVAPRPCYDLDEALGRLLLLYGRAREG